MSQINLMRRAVNAISTRTIIVVVSASVAGVMVLSVVTWILVRCHTKRKRLAATSGDAVNTPVAHVESGDSFIQSPPFVFPESPAITVPTTREPVLQSLPTLHNIPEEPARVLSTPSRPMRPYPSRETNRPSQEARISPIDHVDRQSTSVSSVYSNASFALSQYSLPLGPTYQSAELSRLPTIPASPNIPHALASPSRRVMPLNVPLKSILKSTSSPSSPAHPQTPSTSPGISISSRFSAPRPIPSSLFESPSSSEHLSAVQPESVFRRRRSQSNTSVTESHSGHGPSSPGYNSTPIVSERSLAHNETVAEGFTAKPSQNVTPGSPLRPHARSHRKSRPEPLRLRPRENYASVVYARARGPGASETRGHARRHARPPALSNIPGDAMSTQTTRNHFSNRNSDETETFETSLPSTVVHLPRTRHPLPSPTWSTFRNSPGWV